MKRFFLIFFLLVTISSLSQGVVSNNSGSAILKLNSSSQGFLPPIMTETQVLAIASPAEGLVLYCTNCTPKGLYVYDGHFFYNILSGSAEVETIAGQGGTIWMARNLGATSTATSISDSQAFGSLYQFGRGNDGHQLRTSTGVSATSSVTTPVGTNSGAFLYGSSNWYSGSTTLWDISANVNNPCPVGFRIPSASEFRAEQANISSTAGSGSHAAAAFTTLKLTTAGARLSIDGTFIISHGYYWTNDGQVLQIGTTSTISTAANKASGYSVRCIKK